MTILVSGVATVEKDRGLEDMWIMDSICSRHMTGHHRLFFSLNLMSSKEYITFGGQWLGKKRWKTRPDARALVKCSKYQRLHCFSQHHHPLRLSSQVIRRS
ncbi:hypothetical protein GUJ93_ZPchr0010g11062 [Zizania palustris]|uniref:Uncharacterized protein n=1 Tax=Zizania palustris TaxID=103762 RepID=A0A8J6BHX0_ZIZPA|nr:hypothetical protein GUJ93_ZPchr0010g11062 [Zizania palustris]